MLARFGSEVSLVYRDELPLKGFDEEVSSELLCAAR